MKRKARDYRAEYHRRIARGSAAGLSRSQARGHARSGEAPTKPSSKRDADRLARGIRTFLKGKSITGAAKDAGVSAERLRRALYEQRIAERVGRRVQGKVRVMTTISDGQRRTIKVDFNGSSRVGTYLNAVDEFLKTNDVKLLSPFVGEAVTDLSGRRHLFETDPNVLYELGLTGSGTFEQVYRLTTVI